MLDFITKLWPAFNKNPWKVLSWLLVFSNTWSIYQYINTFKTGEVKENLHLVERKRSDSLLLEANILVAKSQAYNEIRKEFEEQQSKKPVKK